MTADSINRWLTLGANVGVLAGIAFLAVELQQNNELLAAQTQAERFDRSSGFAEEIMRNPTLATAIKKIENNEEITDAEEVLVRAMALRTFRQLEWQFRETEAGRLHPPIALEVFRQGFRSQGIFRWPLGDYWAEMKPFFASDFVQYVEENIVNFEHE